MSTAKAYPGSSTATVSGTVAVSSLPATPTGTNMIGNVTPQPVSARVAGSDTNVAAGTRRTFPSTTYTQGFYFVNNHATAIAYIGDPATVSSTVYDFYVLPGTKSEWMPYANPNVFGWDTDTSGMVLKTIGG